MKSFNNVKFSGTFRNYQQRVLDNCKKYYKNNKIHIVAAPGSGKTILGLELIARLGEPCLVLSPTNTIKYQWGERFADFYLPQGENIDDYVSFDLKNIKLLTSITYQALHSAIDKIQTEDEDGIIDYSEIDLFKIINEFGIRTICVDEAHHLQNEWQKALEKFMEGLPKDFKVVALTATPPYDATDEEWQRYVEICGEIDEEIFVTELVQAKNLCPHQDYVYLSYPTDEETKEFFDYKKNVEIALTDFSNSQIINKIYDKIITIYNNQEDELINHSSSYINLLTLLNYCGKEINLNLINFLCRAKKLPKFSTIIAENSLLFLLKDKAILTKSDKDLLKKTFKKHGLLERGQICLDLNDTLKQKLIKSLGKLDSICDIVNLEYNNLESNLRLLVLTDYIKKESVSYIGTNKEFSAISVVSIFEKIRRKRQDISLAILSGGLCVLPTKLKDKIFKQFNIDHNKLEIKELNNTGYAVYNFKMSNKEKVKIVGKFFTSGDINVLVGTKSLLGEGWDAPCVNSIILASFVGSFMLSNQMRGRAIRVNKAEPNKTANIWHLITLEPKHTTVLDSNDLSAYDVKKSFDYQTLERRFKCFVGPSFNKGNIENGIERLFNLNDVNSRQNMQILNQDMMDRAIHREHLFSAWKIENPNSAMHMTTLIPKDRKIVGLAIKNLFFAIIMVVACGLGIAGLINCFIFGVKSAVFCLLLISSIMAILLGTIFGYNSIFKFWHLITIRGVCCFAGNSILKTLKKMKEINRFAKLSIYSEKNYAVVVLLTQSIREQTVFQNALCEFLGIINNPRYLLIKSNIFGKNCYKYSFQCPKIIANNKKKVLLFKQNIKKYIGNMNIVYVNNPKLKSEIFNCEKKTYIHENSKIIDKKMCL